MCVCVCVCACACAYAHVCMTVDALCVSTYKTVVVDNFALLHGTKSYIFSYRTSHHSNDVM